MTDCNYIDRQISGLIVLDQRFIFLFIYPSDHSLLLVYHPASVQLNSAPRPFVIFGPLDKTQALLMILSKVGMVEIEVCFGFANGRIIVLKLVEIVERNVSHKIFCTHEPLP